MPRYAQLEKSMATSNLALPHNGFFASPRRGFIQRSLQQTPKAVARGHKQVSRCYTVPVVTELQIGRDAIASRDQ